MASPLTLSPPVAGGWKGALDYEISGLEHDTVYSLATAPLVTDVSANPITPIAVNFATHVRPPTNGPLLPGTVSLFRASSDPDGVVTIGLFGSGSSGTFSTVLALSRINPKTGTLEFLNAQNRLVSDLTNIAPTSWSRALPDLSAERTSGVAFRLGGTGLLFLPRPPGPSIPTDILQDLLVPVPAGSQEPANAGPVGSIVNTTFIRPQMPTEDVGFVPDQGFFASPDLWFVIREDNGNLRMRSRACSPCRWFVEELVGTGLTPLKPSGAVVKGGPNQLTVVFAFDRDASTRREVCISKGLIPGGFQDWPRDEALSVAVRSQTKLIGARWSSAGLQLLERPIGFSCDAFAWTWTVLATVPNTAALPHTKPIQAVMFGPSPGILYLDANSALTAFVL